MRARGERGASLIIVLALVTVLAIVVPATLVLTLTGSRATVPVVRDRHAQYAATSAIDAAIQTARRLPDVGVPGGPCPEQSLTIDGMVVTVSCYRHALSTDGCYYLDRYVTYVADVRRSGSSTVVGRAAAQVALRYDGGIL